MWFTTFIFIYFSYKDTFGKYEIFPAGSKYVVDHPKSKKSENSRYSLWWDSSFNLPITDMFLGYEFSTYGVSAASFLEEQPEDRIDPMSRVFPR